jgi:predicted transcriptional regulator
LYKSDGIGQKHLVTLEKIRESLEKLNAKIDVLIELRKVSDKEVQKFPDTPLDAITLLNLPDHLRKTALAVYRNGRSATAEEIAYQTSRARAMESSYLNQLVTMGYLKKHRKGKKAYFYIERE